MDGEGASTNMSNLDRVNHADQLLRRAGELMAKADANLSVEEWVREGDTFELMLAAEGYANLAYSYLFSVEIRQMLYE